MKFTDDDILYLTGKYFSNGYHLLLQDNTYISRLNCIIKLLKGKRVLHIGCCDHIPLITKKIENKTWLHGLLMDNCSFVVGVDINAEAIEYITNKVSYPQTNNLRSCVDNVFYADVTDSIPKKLQNTIFDFAVLGEMVEHVNDPVTFLTKIKKNIGKNVDKIVITVPNALCFVWYIQKKKFYSECINTDHRYWFTPYTIAKVSCPR